MDPPTVQSFVVDSPRRDHEFVGNWRRLPGKFRRRPFRRLTHHRRLSRRRGRRYVTLNIVKTPVSRLQSAADRGRHQGHVTNTVLVSAYRGAGRP